MVEIELNFKFLKIKGNWDLNNKEKESAWKFYVELVTRISVQKLVSGEGILREALNSLYSLFAITRTILKNSSSDIVSKRGKNQLTFTYISIVILNKVLRPFLTKWHPWLQMHESSRPENISIFEHEKGWSKHEELRNELEELRNSLIEYARCLEIVIDIDSLIDEDHITTLNEENDTKEK